MTTYTLPKRFHHADAGCQYAAGYDPMPGDLVTLCTAQAVWRVRQIEPDGKVTVDPHSGPGVTWRTPLTLAAAHLDLLQAPEGVLW